MHCQINQAPELKVWPQLGKGKFVCCVQSSGKHFIAGRDHVAQDIVQ
jgi:hypothetical protein